VILDGTAAILSNLLSDKHGRKIVCVQGLGFVGAANAIAIASARDGAGNALYSVIGVDLPTESGRERAATLNQGAFPFATTDAALVDAARSARAAATSSPLPTRAFSAKPISSSSRSVSISTIKPPPPRSICRRFAPPSARSAIT
jgi:hypothetical protein